MISALCHAARSGWTPVEDLDDLSHLAAEPNSLLWVEATARELDEREVTTLAAGLGIDATALSRAARSTSRPKIDVQPQHVLLVLHQLDEVTGQLEASQMTFFVGDNFVLVVHDGGERTLDEAKRRWADLRAEGPPYLVHTL